MEQLLSAYPEVVTEAHIEKFGTKTEQAQYSFDSLIDGRDSKRNAYYCATFIRYQVVSSAVPCTLETLDTGQRLCFEPRSIDDHVANSCRNLNYHLTQMFLLPLEVIGIDSLLERKNVLVHNGVDVVCLDSSVHVLKLEPGPN